MHDMEEAHCCTFGYSPHDSSKYYQCCHFKLVGKHQSTQCLVVLLWCLSNRSGYLLPMHHYVEDKMLLRSGGADRILSVNFWLYATVSNGRHKHHERAIMIKKLHAVDNSAVVYRGRLCR